MPSYVIDSDEKLRLVILSARKGRGLSQAALAAALGMSQQNYAAFERAPARASMSRVLEVFKALGLKGKVDYLPAAQYTPPPARRAVALVGSTAQKPPSSTDAASPAPAPTPVVNLWAGKKRVDW